MKARKYEQYSNNPDALKALGTEQLQALWTKIFKGQRRPQSNDLIIHKIAYFLQVHTHGGLSKRAQNQLHRLIYGNLYTYYVSQRTIKEGTDVPGIRRISMDDVDGLALKHIQEFVPKDWEKKSIQEKRALVARYIEKVVLHEEKIELVLKTENGPEVCSVPMLLRKYGHKKLVLDAQGKEVVPTRGNKDPALMTALVRAHRWERALTSNSQKSLFSIAKAEDLETKYVTKIYRLNFLSPKIKEAILDGIQPRTLTLSRLMHGIPLSWQEQEHLYGF